jgi:hypothetical protein
MKNCRNHTAYAFAIAAFMAVLYTAPATAGGGRSGAQASSAESRAQASERASREKSDTQAQIDALRKEMAALKAQLDLNKSVATAK